MKVQDYVLEYFEEFPIFWYKLKMNDLWNDKLIDDQMQGLTDIWLANMDFQLVVDDDNVIVYTYTYVIKQEIKINSGMNKIVEK